MSENNLIHPILAQSLAIVDQEIGEHHLNPLEYAIARRAIHSTADFEFLQLLKFSPDGIEAGVAALQSQTPIITDVRMVKQGIATLASRTFNNPLIAAIEQAAHTHTQPGQTRTEIGIRHCFERYPQAIYAVGSAPTALLALCRQVASSPLKPALIIGAPVGFVSVVESKQALAETSVPQIRVEGRKGGSAVAAAIVNALLVLAWDNLKSKTIRF